MLLTNDTVQTTSNTSRRKENKAISFIMQPKGNGSAVGIVGAFLRLILFILVTMFTLQASSNSYDDAEKARRAQEMLDRFDKADRDKARERYDKAHPEPSSGNGTDGGLCLLLIPVGIGLVLYAAYKDKKR